MAFDRNEILENLDNNEYLKWFIRNAKLYPSTAEANQTRVASEIALMRTISKQSERIAGSLDELGRSLVESAKAAETHANSLKWATWALFFATIGLVVATGVLAVVAVIGERA